jgi:hypothetical protein
VKVLSAAPLKNPDKPPSTNGSFAATISPASTKMLNRLYPAELEGHWRTM